MARHSQGRSRARGTGASVGWVAAGGYLSLVVGANWARSQHLLTLGALAIPEDFDVNFRSLRRAGTAVGVQILAQLYEIVRTYPYQAR